MELLHTDTPANANDFADNRSKITIDCEVMPVESQTGDFSHSGKNLIAINRNKTHNASLNHTMERSVMSFEFFYVVFKFMIKTLKHKIC